jgi:5-methylcytosine-specific restriction endonuclease McrA
VAILPVPGKNIFIEKREQKLMPRPIKEGLDYFPKWNPQRATVNKINSIDFEIRYKALRYSSSGFIHRSDVRNIIFKRDGYKCVLCGNKNNLQVDHIISIWKVAKKEYPIKLLNAEINLQTLCKECNERKRP